MVGNFAQIYSPYLYEKKNGPRYLTAMTANSELPYTFDCQSGALY